MINDLFPGIAIETVEYEELQVAITRNVEKANLINHPPWNLKLIQVKLLAYFILFQVKFFETYIKQLINFVR